MSDLEKIYWRKHAVTIYKEGLHMMAFQTLFKNGRERKDLRSLLYMGWMLLYGQGCSQNHRLAVRAFKQVMKREGTPEAEEASKLLAVIYLSGKIKYTDKKWAGWTLAGSQLLDLRQEESF